jgi:hypothetical protein
MVACRCVYRTCFFFVLAIAACVPTLPSHDGNNHNDIERAIAALPGVRRVVMSDNGIVVVVADRVDAAAITVDVAKLSGRPIDSLLVRTEASHHDLMQIGPWQLSRGSRWPWITAAIALLAVIAIASGALAWKLLPRALPRDDVVNRRS